MENAMSDWEENLVQGLQSSSLQDHQFTLIVDGLDYEITKYEWSKLSTLRRPEWCCIIRKNGTDVIHMNQHRGGTLVSFQGHRFDTNLTLVDAVSFLKKGFAAVYNKYNQQLVNVMKLDDISFQHFVFVKMLNFQNVLDLFFDVCVYEDDDRLYKLWINIAYRRGAVKLTDDLTHFHAGMTNHEAWVNYTRTYTKRKQEIWELDGKNGSELGQKLIDIADPTIKTKLQINIGNKIIFKVNWKGDGNGSVTFDPEDYMYSPKWTFLCSKILKPGFAASYRQLLSEKFKKRDSNKLSKNTNHAFQAFVLLQFEIARRQERHRDDGLNRFMVKNGINMAIDIDKPKYYEYMTKMFRGKKRSEYYELLINRSQFEEVVQEAEKKIDEFSTASRR